MDVLKTLKVRGLIDIYTQSFQRMLGLCLPHTDWASERVEHIEAALAYPSFFNPPPHTKATTGRQWLRSDNKQIKQSAYKRFIASLNKGPPWRTTLRSSIEVNFTQSPCFSLEGLSTTRRASTIKIQMKLGELSSSLPSGNPPPVLFSCKLKSYRTYPLSSCYKPGTQCSSRGGMKPPRSAQVTATNQGWNLQAKDRDWV